MAGFVGDEARVTVINLSGCGYGSDLSSTVSIRLKIAVLAPMPKPRIRIAVVVKPGDLSRSRKL